MDKNERARFAAWKMAGGRCELCGKTPASERRVSFSRNVGMLVQRREYRVIAHMCGPCLHGNFCRFSLLNLCLGWWGMISLFLTPIFAVVNVCQYAAGLFSLRYSKRGN
jgi:hypothetical protein